MTDIQLYFVIGVPVLMNGAFLLARFDLMMGKISELDTRLSVVEDRIPR